MRMAKLRQTLWWNHALWWGIHQPLSPLRLEGAKHHLSFHSGGFGMLPDHRAKACHQGWLQQAGESRLGQVEEQENGARSFESRSYHACRLEYGDACPATFGKNGAAIWEVANAPCFASLAEKRKGDGAVQGHGRDQREICKGHCECHHQSRAKFPGCCKLRWQEFCEGFGWSHWCQSHCFAGPQAHQAGGPLHLQEWDKDLALDRCDRWKGEVGT